MGREKGRGWAEGRSKGQSCRVYCSGLMCSLVLGLTFGIAIMTRAMNTKLALGQLWAEWT